MKSIRIILVASLLTVSLLVSTPVFAQSVQGSYMGQLQAAAGDKGAGFSAPKDPRALAAAIIKTAMELLGTIFLGLIIYAGYLWMTAGGESEKVDKAKKLIFQAVIGLIIVLAAYSITLFAIKISSGSYTQYNSGVWVQVPTAPTCQGLECP